MLKRPFYLTQECCVKRETMYAQCVSCPPFGMLPGHYNFQRVLIKISCVCVRWAYIMVRKNANEWTNEKKISALVRFVPFEFGLLIICILCTDLWLVHIIYWVKLSLMLSCSISYEDTHWCTNQIRAHAFCPNNKTAYRTCKLNTNWKCTTNSM